MTKKAIIIGLDAPIAQRVHKFATEGLLPSLNKLISEGVYADNYLVPYPTVTPQIWTTIATGANIGTHGVTAFGIHFPGEDLPVAHSAWNSSFCKAEYVWEAAERAGKKSIVINWPCVYPARMKLSYQLGGTGLAMNEWRTEREKNLLYRADLSDAQLFTTRDLNFAVKITLNKASGWKRIEPSTSSLEADLKLKYTVCLRKGEAGERHSKIRSPERWFMLVQDTKGEGYDKVLLSETKNVDQSFSALSLGEWSDTIIRDFQTEDDRKKSAFKCKLLELSKDGRKVSLLVTPISNLKCYSYPESLFAEVAKLNPLAMPSHVFFDGFMFGWYDEKTFIELVDMEHKWFADAATYLMKKKEWNLLLMHMHAPDWMYHNVVPPEGIDPASKEYKGLKKAEYYEKIEIQLYKSIDKTIGNIVEAAGKDTLVVVVSDHGAIPKTDLFSPIKPLANAGLLNLIQTQNRTRIDLQNSIAIPDSEGPWIYVNLKGRYSHGIVNETEYEAAQEEIIDALRNYKDPATKKNPVSLALKKRDAKLLGLYGDRIGDVVYASNKYYGGHHGELPTIERGIGSLRGLLIMAGPSLKKGLVLKRIVHATDIVPTVCHITGIPVPEDAEGAIIYQALQKPNSLQESNPSRKNGSTSEEIPSIDIFETFHFES